MPGTNRAASRREAVQRLHDAGLRVTPQRTAVLQALMGAAEPVTARAVWQEVRAAHPSVSLDTVYRNLTALVHHGLINQVNLQNRESARFEFQGDAGHHHHFVCLDCGRAFCVEACPVPAVTARPDDDPGFEVRGHAFEVYGLCSGCQDRSPEQRGQRGT